MFRLESWHCLSSDVGSLFILFNVRFDDLRMLQETIVHNDCVTLNMSSLIECKCHFIDHLGPDCIIANVYQNESLNIHQNKTPFVMINSSIKLVREKDENFSFLLVLHFVLSNTSTTKKQYHFVGPIRYRANYANCTFSSHLELQTCFLSNFFSSSFLPIQWEYDVNMATSRPLLSTRRVCSLFFSVK